MQKLPQCRELEKYFVKIFTVGGGVGGGDGRSVEAGHNPRENWRN